MVYEVTCKSHTRLPLTVAGNVHTVLGVLLLKPVLCGYEVIWKTCSVVQWLCCPLQQINLDPSGLITIQLGILSGFLDEF